MKIFNQRLIEKWMKGMFCKHQTEDFHGRMIDYTTNGNKLTDKREMIKLLLAGKLGNTLRQWESLESLEKDDYKGNVTIRCRAAGSGFCKYNVEQQSSLSNYLRPIYQQIEQWLLTTDDWIDPDSFYFNESAPDHDLIFQGEFVRINKENVLFLSEQKMPMRNALKIDGFHMLGHKVLPYIKSKMTIESYSDFVLIHQMYASAVIEFSVYNKPLGNRPKRNAVIWEVRDY